LQKWIKRINFYFIFKRLNGKVYEVNNFTLINVAKPNYFYFKDSNILYSRIKFQKHKLKNLLDNFDSSKTEMENMIDNGYRVIFDSGNKVYLKEFWKNKRKL